MKYFLDTYALIEIAEGNPSYKEYLEVDCITLKDNLAELFYFFLKKYDEKTADYFLNKFAKLTMDMPVGIIAKAMLFRYQNVKTGFSYIDCLGYIYAKENKMLFLTGDRAFQGMDNVKIVR